MAPPFFLNGTAAAGSLPTPAQLLLPVSFDSTLGAMLVGTMISYGSVSYYNLALSGSPHPWSSVFGVNLHQAWRYHNQYSHSDTWAIKLVVSPADSLVICAKGGHKLTPTKVLGMT